jgi:lipid-binding SYLF domain-containing protein
MKMRKLAVCAMTLLWSIPTLAQPPGSDESQRVKEAAAVLSDLAATPDRAIPHAVLERAEAIAIFPSVKKAGFVVGGQWGRGVISLRDASGAWSAPAFLRLAGGSFGAQIGAQRQGLFAGATINGASVAEDDANARCYGQAFTSQEVVGGKVAKVPKPAEALTDALSRIVPERKAGS